mmetsp:Transcript_40772/g.115326  ORF Transcript_40772/g.115326 Transcript_40772/m.115326 type:complete len:232 (+) Transcript_40772:991-1686(+)
MAATMPTAPRPPTVALLASSLCCHKQALTKACGEVLQALWSGESPAAWPRLSGLMFPACHRGWRLPTMVAFPCVSTLAAESPTARDLPGFVLENPQADLRFRFPAMNWHTSRPHPQSELLFAHLGAPPWVKVLLIVMVPRALFRAQVIVCAQRICLCSKPWPPRMAAGLCRTTEVGSKKMEPRRSATRATRRGCFLGHPTPGGYGLGSDCVTEARRGRASRGRCTFSVPPS